MHVTVCSAWRTNTKNPLQGLSLKRSKSRTWTWRSPAWARDGLGCVYGFLSSPLAKPWSEVTAPPAVLCRHAASGQWAADFSPARPGDALTRLLEHMERERLFISQQAQTHTHTHKHTHIQHILGHINTHMQLDSLHSMQQIGEASL